MSKLFYKLTVGIVFVVTMIALASCSSGNETKYIAAKLVDSDMWSIVDVNSGEVIHEDEFKNQPSVIVNDKFCVKNESGLYDYFSVDDVTKPINSESYLYATSFNNNDIALAVRKGECITIINGKCEDVAILDNSIVTASDFANGYSVITNDDDKKGYINEDGKIVIEPTYDIAYSFSQDGIAIIGKKLNDSDTKYFAIDEDGEELFSFSSSKYSDFGLFINGYIPVKKSNDEVIMLDKSGEKLCSIGKWDGFIPNWLGFNDDVIVFNEGDTYGLKDNEGKIVIRAKYEILVPIPGINSSYYLAKKKEKYGIIDKNDEIVIPFDYDGLGYLNKDVLCVWDEDIVSLINTDLKDVGKNDFKDISFSSGPSIRSNYFNADKEAQRIITNITDSSFFKTHKGMVLRDFKEKLSGYKYADMDEHTLNDYDYPFSFIYGFDKSLSSQRYEYFYGYSFPKGPEYNYNANLVMAIALSSSYTEYQPGAEERLAKAFDAQILKLGFKPMEGNQYYFVNDKTGTAVGLGYEDGVVKIHYVYDLSYASLELNRQPREESSNNITDDYVVTTEDIAVAVDSVAVDTVDYW